MARPAQPLQQVSDPSQPREIIILDSDSEGSDGSVEFQPAPKKPGPPLPPAANRQTSVAASAANQPSTLQAARSRSEPQLPSSSATSEALPDRPPSPDYPLPHPAYPFDILNHAPARHPAPPLAYKAPEQMTTAERAQEHFREEEREERDRAQRRLRELVGHEWEWEWTKVEVNEKAKSTQHPVRCLLVLGSPARKFQELTGGLW